MANTPTLQADQVADAFNAVPGATVEMFRQVPGGTYVVTDTVNFQPFDSSFTQTFTVPVTGKYLVVVNGSMFGSGGIAGGRIRLKFDEGLGSEQVVGDDDASWTKQPGSGAHTSASFVTEVELTAGQHTFRPECKRIALYGSGSPAVDVNSSWIVRGSLIAGSGAGGTIIGAVEKTADQNTISSGVDTLISNMTLTFNASPGEDVKVVWDIQMQASASENSIFLLVRIDAGSWIPIELRTGHDHVPFTGSYIFENLASGAHTVEFGVRSDQTIQSVRGGGDTSVFGHALTSKAWAVQHRGGLVSIRASGVEITPTPQYVDFIGAHQVATTLGGVSVSLPSAVTSSGSLVRVTADQPTTAKILLGGSYTQFFPDTTGSVDFTITTAGRYRVTFSGVIWGDAGAGTGQLELRIDEGGADPKTIGGDTDDTWRTRVHSGELSSFTVVGEVELSAGVHNLKAYGKIIAGSGLTFFGTATAEGVDIVADFMLVSGSGAGGAIVSSDTLSAGFNVATTTPTSSGGGDPFVATAGDFTDNHVDSGLEVTIDTFEGETIDLEFTGWISQESADNGTFYCHFDIDGTVLEARAITILANSSLMVHNKEKRTLSAGSHTIKLRVANDSGDNTTLHVGARLDVTQYRGGLVPIRHNGTDVVQKPAAIDFVNGNVANVGGVARISLLGAEGASIAKEGTILSDYSVMVINTWEDVDNGGGDKLEVTFETFEDEVVLIVLNGSLVNLSTAHESGLRIDVDGSTHLNGTEDSPTAAAGNAKTTIDKSIALSFAAGSHTIKAQVFSSSTSTFVESDTEYTRLQIIRLRGGYVNPENTPTIKFSTGAVVSVESVLGASTELRLTLNDGKRYTATSPITCDLGVSGIGGLETTNFPETSSTFYFLYAVPSATDGRFDLVFSPNDPSTGPDDFTVWKYLGPRFNNSSSDLVKWFQYGDTVRFNSAVQPSALSSTTLSTTLHDPKITTSVADTVPVTAISMSGFMRIRRNGVGGNFLANELYVDGESTFYVQNGNTESGGFGDNTVAFDDLPLPTSPKQVQYRSFRDTGSHVPSEQVVWLTGFRDGYLGTQGVQLQAKFVPDTASSKGTWQTGTTVDFKARPGQSSTVRKTLQDGKQRTFTGTLNWDNANNVADLGWDEASSQAAGDKWIYFYEVPKSGADDELTIRASDNTPNTGPTGYTDYRLCWCSYRASGSLEITRQRNNYFWRTRHREPASISALTKTAIHEPGAAFSVDDVVPYSAGELLSSFSIYHPGTSGDTIYAEFFADGDIDTATTGDNTFSAQDFVTYRTGTEQFSPADFVLNIPLLEGATKQIGMRIFRGSGGIVPDNFTLFAQGWVDEYIDP